jgi:hypothetical protein
MSNGFEEFNPVKEGNIKIPYNSVPKFIRAEVAWYDQGWGNRIGAIKLQFVNTSTEEVLFEKDLFG